MAKEILPLSIRMAIICTNLHMVFHKNVFHHSIYLQNNLNFQQCLIILDKSLVGNCWIFIENPFSLWIFFLKENLKDLFSFYMFDLSEVHKLFLKRWDSFYRKRKLNKIRITFVLEMKLTISKNKSFDNHFTKNELNCCPIFEVDKIWPNAVSFDTVQTKTDFWFYLAMNLVISP